MPHSHIMGGSNASRLWPIITHDMDKSVMPTTKAKVKRQTLLFKNMDALNNALNAFKFIEVKEIILTTREYPWEGSVPVWEVYSRHTIMWCDSQCNIRGLVNERQYKLLQFIRFDLARNLEILVLKPHFFG